MIDPKTSARLTAVPEKEWGVIFKELTLYAEYKLERMGFEQRSEIDNVTGEDFATQAIEKLFDGTRSWDVARFPDLLIHLKGIVKSLLSNHLKSSTRATVRKEKVGEMVDEMPSRKPAHIPTDEDTPDQILITDENWKYIENEFGDDMVDFFVFCEWIDYVPPRTIASNYDISVKDVYNILKRGRRIIKKLFGPTQ